MRRIILLEGKIPIRCLTKFVALSGSQSSPFGTLISYTLACKSLVVKPSSGVAGTSWSLLRRADSILDRMLRAPKNIRNRKRKIKHRPRLAAESELDEVMPSFRFWIRRMGWLLGRILGIAEFATRPGPLGDKVKPPQLPGPV